MKTADKNESYAKLYKDNYKRAYFAAYALTGSQDEAYDLSQEAFTKAYENFAGFDSARNFFSWYYRIMKNIFLNRLRQTEKVDRTPKFELVSDADLTGGIEKKETAAKVHKAISMLDKEEQEIIILREFERYPVASIAEMLDIPQGTALSRLFYARKKLAVILKDRL